MSRYGLILGIAVAAGCHRYDLAVDSPPPPQLPTGPRGTIAPDVSAVAARPASKIPERPKEYHLLTAEECRARAVQHAAFADTLDAHPDNTPPPHARFHRDQPEFAQLSRLARGYAADELRNRAAAEALELYWKFAAAEGQFDLLAAAHAILREQLAAAEKAVKAGLADRADADKFRRQLLNLESQLAKLEASLAVLDAALGAHLGLDPGDPTPIWPADPLRVGSEVDVNAAVQTALHYRPDLNMLRTVTASEDFGGELAKAVIASINPLLNTRDSANPLVAFVASIKNQPTRAEAKLHAQLVSILRSRERQAEAEVRAAAATLRGERSAIAAKAAEIRNLEEKVADLEKRAAAGLAGAEAELVAARIDLLKLRGELVQLVADWHVAEVKLRQAMGMLVRE